jgi:hypothetical protein
VVAWGVKSFENDTAMDFLHDAKRLGHEYLTSVFREPKANSGKQLTARQACIIIAGAELVAGKFGTQGDMPVEARRVLPMKALSEDLQSPARDAVSVALKTSELRDLWLETDSFEKWENDVLDLLERLK